MRVIALVGAILGYYFYYNMRWKKKNAYFPIIVVSWITFVMYIAGVLECLKWGTFSIVFIGWFLLFGIFVMTVKKKKLDFYIKAVFNSTIICMLIGLIWLWVITRGVGLSHYDDFSHWYRICKMMHVENAYPSQPDMYFPSYVPGTATWIYFITRFISFSAENCLFAQAILILSCCAVFLGVIGEKIEKKCKALSFIYVFVVSTILCAMNVSIYSLLVDTVLALIPLAVVVLIFNERDRMDIKLYFGVMLGACFTALVKTSGLLLVFFIALAWFMNVNQNNERKNVKKNIIISFLLTIIPFLCTRLYINRSVVIYGNISDTYQGVSLNRYLGIFSGKTFQDIVGIFGKYMSEIFKGSGMISQVKVIWICLAFMLIFYYALKYFHRKETVWVKNIFLYVISFFVLYNIGLLFTYMFSMGENEANSTYLASFYRYMGTASIFITGIVAFVILYIIMNISVVKQKVMLAVSCIMFGILGMFYFDTGYVWGRDFEYQKENYTTDAWELCQKYVPESWEYNDYSYLVLWNSDDFQDSGKIWWLMSAYLRSVHIETYNLEDLKQSNITEDQKSKMKQCEYLVTLGDFSSSIDVINEYVSVRNYKPGISEIN
ncbi:hypothetical protein [Blautia sp. Marseille-P3201T]|uniref:hypothetical protein n=1 Tax=Blautia sp. Marseille-P3201T TaxID=1907659 RepID=UPI0009319D99|nr:hypothetical protein [Blautia sp. Marseille-P3201T]